MIDVDNSGTLTKEEIKKSVKSDKEVIDFLKDCGEENLQFLLEPKRLDRALNALDTSQDGEVDVDEWEEAIQRGLKVRLAQLAEDRERRERAAAAEDGAFTAEFMAAARKVFSQHAPWVLEKADAWRATPMYRAELAEQAAFEAEEREKAEKKAAKKRGASEKKSPAKKSKKKTVEVADY